MSSLNLEPLESRQLLAVAASAHKKMVDDSQANENSTRAVLSFIGSSVANLFACLVLSVFSLSPSKQDTIHGCGHCLTSSVASSFFEVEFYTGIKLAVVTGLTSSIIQKIIIPYVIPEVHSIPHQTAQTHS